MTRFTLSLLSLGSEGCIQITHFIVCGVLVLVSALGFRAALAGHRGGTTARVLVAIYGLGLVVAGTFHPDPANGYPIGTPMHVTTSSTTHNDCTQSDS